MYTIYNYSINTDIVFTFILVCLLILLILAYDHFSDEKKYNEYHENYENNKNYEKNIHIQTSKPPMWVYWEKVNGSDIPPYIDLCMEIIKKNGSRFFRVTFLNEKNIFDFIPDLRSDINDLPIALKTDYIRIKLLHIYGGIWIDADTILMSNLKELCEKLNDGIDFIGFGCTGAICKDQEGYGRPSNGVIGSRKNGRLVEKCLSALNKKLDEYYLTPKNLRKDFDYFDLGKKIIWTEYDQIIKSDPTYKIYHVPSYSDGTRDKDGKWIAKILIFEKDIQYSKRDKLLVVMLANSSYCGNDPAFNWFCKLSRDQVINGKYFISGLFRDALSYDPQKC
jgi:hypothetical protein